MNIILQILLIIVVFLPTKYVVHYITEVKGLPQWLDYRPWNCRLCLTFWLLIAAYLTLWLAFACLYTGVGGIIFAILNAIAMKVDQKNKTLTIEEYNNTQEKEDTNGDLE